MQPTVAQKSSLLALRITVGLLLFWWGLACVMNPEMGSGISEKFYFGALSGAQLQYFVGWAQVAIGLLAAAGLFRAVVAPVVLAVVGLSALSFWNALLDPFGFYLPVEKVSGAQHLFYPSAVVIAGAVVLIVFRSWDRYALDHLLRGKSTAAEKTA